MTPPRRPMHPQTQMLMAGYDPQLSEGSVVPPLFRTSTFVFRSAADGKRAFQLAYGLDEAAPGEIPALIYTRVNNPNVNIVEDRIVAWDGAEAAALFSSGMGAIACACFTHLRPGDSLLFADPVYGGTEYLFRHSLPEFGIQAVPYPAGSKIEVVREMAAGMKNLKMIYMETCANPSSVLNDIAAAAQLAAELDPRPLVVVDNTYLGPVFCQPIRLGADIVVYSATKFIGGHSDLIAGFALGRRSVVTPMLGTRTIFGACPDPETAWLICRSLGTLRLRMEKQAESAARVARFLQSDPRVKDVLFPGLDCMGTDQVELYQRQCSGPGSVMSFTVEGGEREAFAVLDNLRVFHLAVSLGGIESLAEHPYTMTHAELDAEIKERVGISPALVRISVGLEDVDDLVADLRQALDAMERMVARDRSEELASYSI
ncbi:MAG: PLP-dependent transferase [Candidatus Sumerlaeia bacterium]|nr:PLP-dependent transferase [Candidatus Sumerlaeia bacterium]